jgi:hypothetical protein
MAVAAKKKAAEEAAKKTSRKNEGVKAKVAKAVSPKSKRGAGAPAKTAPAKVRSRVDSRPEAPAKPARGGKRASDNYPALVRNSLGVSRDIFARMTGFSVRAIAGWEAGRVIGEPGMRRLKEMARLRSALAEVMRESFIPTWLTNPCEELGNLKPVEVLERGESDRLWRTVLLLGSGLPT